MKKDEAPQKIGAGHAEAMFRQGLAELRGAMYPESNVAQPTAYGIAGTKTPGEVMEDRKGEVLDPDERPSLLDDRLDQIEMEQPDPEPEPPEMEKD